jgi:hypothetical protein
MLKPRPFGQYTNPSMFSPCPPTTESGIRMENLIQPKPALARQKCHVDCGALLEGLTVILFFINSSWNQLLYINNMKNGHNSISTYIIGI